MTLGLALGNAVSALKANQKAIGVLSHNIANANTEGYSRQIIQQEAVYADNVGNGVVIKDVVRNIDSYLSRAVLTQGAAAERTDTISNYQDRIQILIGQPGASNSLDTYVTDYFTTQQQLAENPERTSYRSNAINAADALASNVSDLAYQLEDLRFQADRDIVQSVNKINNLIGQLDSVNVALASASVLGQSKAGLEDQRDSLLRDLSGQLDINTFFDSNGAVSVYVGNGNTLLGDGTRRELQYTPAASADSFANNVALTPIQIVSFDKSGRQVGNPVDLVSGSDTDGNVTTNVSGGTLKGLLDVRDDIIPSILDQLDILASTLRDSINTIHNDGSGFPPAQQLTGTRSVAAGDAFNWTGSVRIAALTTSGDPVPAPYANESYTGWRPLTLDLSFLDSGNGAGKPTVQTIIDEINNHFRAPSFKTSLGNLNNIQLASDTSQLPSIPPSFTFDFDMENISNQSARTFVTGVTVQNSVGTNITSVTQDVPKYTVDPAISYTTTLGSPDVTVRLNNTNGLSVGDMVYLSQPPAGLYNGIPDTDLGGYFVIKSINSNDITFTANTVAGATGPAAAGAGVTAQAAYDTIAAGEQARTRDDGGKLTVDLSADTTTPYYDITVNMGVVDDDNNISTSTITYRVVNQAFNLLNDRYDSISVAGSATRQAPSTTQDALRAILVDANGNELAKVNGQYDPYAQGFLKIVGGSEEYTVAIDELDSKQLGDQDATPTQPGTNWGFSHYFELNNFFESYEPNDTGNTLKGSALHLAVSQRIKDNPNLISMGELVQSTQPADPNAPKQYTYTRNIGDNSIAQRLSQAGLSTQHFAAAGGLPETDLTFVGYSGELLGYVASQAASSTAENTSAQTLLDGFKERSDAISNVNLDEELAATIVYQNAYAASARVVSVVDGLFDDLLGMVK